MVTDRVSFPSAFRKRHGPKKVFSVPVGKLRSNLANPGRNGSSSRSGCRSTCHHKVLLRNNRELARALSYEKEKFRCMVTENVNLKARLHDSRLEVHGLERRLLVSRQSVAVYQNSVRNHLRDAVRHSVSLAESLKLAMGVCFEGPQETPTLPSSPSDANDAASTAQPKNWVKPMVGGHTIRHPTISLRRIVVRGENSISNRNVSSREEQSTETVEDVSQSSEETQRPGGLSTCLEEDEDSNRDINREDVENGDDDSIRRKVISFRSFTVEKDKNMSDSEAGNSPPNETITRVTAESSIDEQISAHICKVPNYSKQPCTPDGPYNPECVLKRTPVVALNDISKFLENSNTINVQKVIFGIDNSKSTGKESDRVLEESDNEKENCPKSSSRNESLVKQKSVSSEMEMHLLKRTSEICVEGSIKKSSFSGSEKMEAIRNDAAVSAINIPCVDEDPLEGTSWMNLNLISEKKMRTRKGNSKKASKEVHSKTADSKRLKGSGSKCMNASKEKAPDCVTTSHAEEDREIMMNTRAEPTDEYDISDFDVGLQNCPIAQSTPLNHGKSDENCDILSTSDVSKSNSKSNSDNNCSNSDGLSDEIISQGKSQPKEGDKNVVTPPVDMKLDSNAFVTVRVKRLTLPDVSLSNKAENNLTEVNNCVNVFDDEVVNFLGFDVNLEVEEKITVMKKIVDSGKEDESRYAYGSCSAVESVSSGGSTSVTHDSQFFIQGESSEGNERVRTRRRAAPVNFKEPSLNKKLRRQ